MNTLSLWLKASRPKTLIAGINPVLIGTLFAFINGSFSWTTFIFTLITALGIQIGTNFSNDYFDYLKGADTSFRKGPKRGLQTKAISLSKMRKAIGYTFAITALSSCYLMYQGGPIIGWMMLFSIGLGLGYTAGPFPLAYIGLGDCFVLFFFGPIATSFTYYLQTHCFNPCITILGLSPGLLSTAILVVNNLRDVEEDRSAQKKTVCVRFGETFCQIEYTLCITLAALIPCFYGYYFPLLILLSAIKPLRAVWNVEDRFLLNTTLQQTGLVSFLFYLFLAFSVFIEQIKQF